MRGYHEYVPVSVKKETANRVLKKLIKKDSSISPIVIQGNKIAKTWWGMAWNKNLENYADYGNRIGRGRSYVKNGFVLDLKINEGFVSALVLGSGLKPYKINIEILPLKKTTWDTILQTCEHRIGSISELADGKFPKELENIFTLKGNGLFPSPSEIKFNCSCPDWAYMCKHVAAVLYGIGAKFDEDPTLFFKLRTIDFELLLKKSVEEKMNSLLKNGDKKSKRIIDDVNIEELFEL